jgi:AraC-like DNA-binding protein
MKVFFEDRTYPSKIPLMISRMENMNFRAHWHMDVELLYVYAGSLKVGVNAESRILNPGEMAICSSGDIHYYDSKGGLQSQAMLMVFRPELIGNIPDWPEFVNFVSPFIDNDLWRKIDAGFFIRNRILELMNALEREMDTENQFYDLFVKSQLLELSATILRHIPSRPRVPGQTHNRTPTQPQSLSVMREVLYYLEEHYMDNLTLNNVAYQFKLNPCYLSRLFNQISGINFKSFLNNIRINQAKKLIAGSNRPLIEIAFECGFNSVRTFNRAFQSIKGYPPSKLR